MLSRIFNFKSQELYIHVLDAPPKENGNEHGGTVGMMTALKIPEGSPCERPCQRPGLRAERLLIPEGSRGSVQVAVQRVLTDL